MSTAGQPPCKWNPAAITVKTITLIAVGSSVGESGGPQWLRSASESGGFGHYLCTGYRGNGINHGHPIMVASSDSHL